MATPAYDQADHFLIPLLDGGNGLGQVLYPAVTVDQDGHVSAPLCLLTGRRMAQGDPCLPIAMSEVVAVELIDPAPLNDGTWPIIGFEQLPPLRRDDELRRLSDRDGGAPQLRETGLIEAFVNACHGLYPWDGFGGTAVFDAFLRPGVARPA
jgi:hypothetical protein